MKTAQEQFEGAITRLTNPLNGQFPRPWMTDFADPLSAEVFIVGKNQSKSYDMTRLLHKRHIDALFNRNGETCRSVYNEITGDHPSPTRKNIDSFNRILAAQNISRVLETNVICYSTPMSRDLLLQVHSGGTVRGAEIFRTLLHYVKPKVLIAHGAGTRDTLGKLFGVTLPEPPTQNGEPHHSSVNGMKVFIIPSLAPPQWNKWQVWAPLFMEKVAKAVARAL